MREDLFRAARAAKGFMPDDEGLALYIAGLDSPGPLLEIGGYCGKSGIYLGAAALERHTVLYSLDHHRGSEEHQPGEEYHDPELCDPRTGRIDTLPTFRRTIADAGLEDVVIAVVGRSRTVASKWSTPLGLVFIDGGHSDHAVQTDYEGWAPHVVRGGLLVVHDVFEDPAEGGQPPFRIVQRALSSGAFAETRSEGSLRVLRRVAQGI